MSMHTRRTKQILGEMRVEEKIAQLCSIWLVPEDGKVKVRSLNGVTQGGTGEDPYERMAHGVGQITRPLGSTPIDPREGVKTLNRMQHFLVNHTRLGIPAIPHEECLAGLMAQGATMFPSSLNLGSLWDEDLVEEIGRAIGEELYSVGARQGLAPVLDVCRDARWGRTEECFGEDPYLVGTLGAAYVRGLQGPDRRLLATLKHYAGHSFSEGGRNHAPLRLGERELRDTFLFPFELAIRRSNAGSVMPAYHEMDGEPMHQSRHFLNGVLREEWGFDGIVVADYEGVSQLHTDHRTQESMSDAAAGALEAGVDQELPSATAYAEGLRTALDKGRLDPAVLDAAVGRVLREKLRLRLFDEPYAEESGVRLNTDESKGLARRGAARSIVLLRNNGVLPLSKPGSVALVGPLADEPLAMLNGYSFPVHHLSHGGEEDGAVVRTLRSELESRLGAELHYVRGCEILTERPKEPPVFPGELGADGSSQKSYVSYDETAIPEAIEAAREASVVILMVGDLSGLFRSGTVGEGSDVSSLSLPGVQEKLMNALLDTGKPIIIVVSSGRPYNLRRGYQEAAAVLQAWLPGQEGAVAIADVLLGVVNPGGKLPVSVPKEAGALPFFYNHKLKSPGTPIQGEFGSVFPFGFGISYTRFALSEFSLSGEQVDAEGELSVRCLVENRGERGGDEVVQLYVRDLYASLTRPVLELKAYCRVYLEPGEGARLTFTLPTDLLSFTDRRNRRVLEPGSYEVLIGTSSKDIHFRREVAVVGEARIIDGDWRMESLTTVEPAVAAGGHREGA